ncbi:hypothetical protein SLS57_000865 [Botryosphaeria dothidea]
MITNFKKRTHREFARKIDESRARFETMAAENNKNQQAVTSKEGQPIEEGDHVSTKIRGGRHEGDVEQVVITQDEAEKAGVQNPPKVLFTDQRGKPVAHNPGTLNNLSKE